VIVTLAIPLTVGGFGLLIVQAPSVGTGVQRALAATTGPLSAGGGLGWVLHVGVFGLLVGGWILGLALVLEEL
jgi:hypothetical protein